MRITTLRAVAGTVLVLVMLTGCGQSQDGGSTPEIASLRTVPAGSAAPAQGAAAERPVLRPDDGPEVYDRYEAAFKKCLVDKGVPPAPEGERPDVSDPKNQAAAAACEHLIPETWMDYEARTNPYYLDRLREVTKCLVAKGYDVTLGGDPVSVMYADNTSANDAYDDEQACQQQAFKEELKKYAPAAS